MLKRKNRAPEKIVNYQKNDTIHKQAKKRKKMILFHAKLLCRHTNVQRQNLIKITFRTGYCASFYYKSALPPFPLTLYSRNDAFFIHPSKMPAEHSAGFVFFYCQERCICFSLCFRYRITPSATTPTATSAPIIGPIGRCTFGRPSTQASTSSHTMHKIQ